jgi:hypothetical protein
MDNLLALWNQSCGQDEAWNFWRIMAAQSLFDTSIAPILERSSLPELVDCHLAAGDLSVIERLLVIYDCG